MLETFFSAHSIFCAICHVSLHQVSRLPFAPWSLLLWGRLPTPLWALPREFQFHPSTFTPQTGEILPAACAGL